MGRVLDSQSLKDRAPQPDAAHLAVGREVLVADRPESRSRSPFNPTLLKKRVRALIHLREEFPSKLASLVHAEVIGPADSHAPRHPVRSVLDDVRFPSQWRDSKREVA